VPAPKKRHRGASTDGAERPSQVICRRIRSKAMALRIGTVILKARITDGPVRRTAIVLVFLSRMRVPESLAILRGAMSVPARLRSANTAGSGASAGRQFLMGCDRFSVA